MNAEPASPAPRHEPKNEGVARPRIFRLRFLIAVMVVYWALYVVVGQVEKPYFYGFIYGLASSLVLTLCFLGWWFFNRALPPAEKILGFLFLVAGAWAAAKFSDRSINFLTLSAVGLPLAVTLLVAWLFFAQRTVRPLPNLAGFAAAVVVGWGSLLCVRTDGLDSALRSHVSWRWTPTAEQRFLAQNPADDQTGNAASSDGAWPPAAPAWPAFRGADRDGVVRGTHIATDWKTAPPRELWRHAVGPAWSSLIIVGNRLYTQEQRGPLETVVCYDATTGRQLWVHEDEARFDEAVSGSGPRATPTYAQDCVYTFGATGLLDCLDARTGDLRWWRDVKVDSQGKPPLWGLSSSPLIAGGNVIVYGGGQTDKSLLAYHADSGKLAWTAPAGQNSYSSPQLVTIDGIAQCLMYHDFGLTSVDPATGKKLWETGLVMRGAPRCGQPHLVGKSTLAVATLDGPGTSLIEVAKSGDQWKTTQRWLSKDLKPEFPDMVVYDGHAYGFDGSIFCCVDLTTGKRTWKDGRFGRGQVILLEDQGLLLVTSETGGAILQAADPQSRKELGRFQALNGKTWNHAVVASGRLYLRNAEEMACYALPAAAQVTQALTLASREK